MNNENEGKTENQINSLSKIKEELNNLDLDLSSDFLKILKKKESKD